MSQVRRGTRWASWLGVLLLFGCEAPERDQNETKAPSVDSAAQTTSLPRKNLRREDRAAWRAVLRWGDECEDAFGITHAGEGAGIDLLPLGGGVTLVAVQCAAGAYQPSFFCYLLDETSAVPTGTRVEFPTYGSPDGVALARTRVAELWGEWTFLPEAGEFLVLSLSRQTRDCGTWARYGFNGREAELLDFWVRLPCPADIEPPVELSKLPPEGWRRVTEH